MRLQEFVDFLPHLRHPVDHLVQVGIAMSGFDLRLDQLTPQVTTQKSFDGLHMVGAQHPPTTQHIKPCITLPYQARRQDNATKTWQQRVEISRSETKHSNVFVNRNQTYLSIAFKHWMSIVN